MTAPNPPHDSPRGPYPPPDLTMMIEVLSGGSQVRCQHGDNEWWIRQFSRVTPAKDVIVAIRAHLATAHRGERVDWATRLGLAEPPSAEPSTDRACRRCAHPAPKHHVTCPYAANQPEAVAAIVADTLGWHRNTGTETTTHELARIVVRELHDDGYAIVPRAISPSGRRASENAELYRRAHNAIRGALTHELVSAKHVEPDFQAAVAVLRQLTKEGIGLVAAPPGLTADDPPPRSDGGVKVPHVEVTPAADPDPPCVPCEHPRSAHEIGYGCVSRRADDPTEECPCPNEPSDIGKGPPEADGEPVATGRADAMCRNCPHPLAAHVTGYGCTSRDPGSLEECNCDVRGDVAPNHLPQDDPYDRAEVNRLRGHHPCLCGHPRDHHTVPYGCRVCPDCGLSPEVIPPC